MARTTYRNKCLQCGKGTNNPKFCCRSCAASYNNVRSPKRKPEGKCHRCGTAIISTKEYCDTCRPIAQQKEDNGREGIRQITLPDGKVVEREIKPIWSYVTLNFETKEFTHNSSCGDLIDTVMGICCSDIQYIREENKKRFVSLLEAFRNYRYASGWANGVVDTLPLTRLFSALGDWVRSYFKSQYHPLMASYALDAAIFIDTLLHGQHRYLDLDTEITHIRPLVSEELYHSIRPLHLFNGQFKKTMTRQIAGLVAVGVVPENCRIVDAWNDLTHEHGSEFAFEITRCHLSSTADVMLTCSTQQSHAKQYFIEDDFQFVGKLISISEQGEYTVNGIVCVPGTWFTHALQWQSDDRRFTRVPVPRWE